MITLHESNITSFPLDNGIGVLSDAIRAYAEEELNGMFEFYMEYDSEGHLVDELKEERIIKAKAQDKLGYQLFRIYSITKNHENDNLIVNAQHITYDLANNFVEELKANRLTKKQVMEKIGASTVIPHSFNLTSSNTTTVSSTNLYRTNPLQMIAGMEGSVLQIWGGQIERDNFNLILHDRRGHDDGVKVTYEKNITGLTAEFDISGVITRIFPFVYIEATDDSPERLITVSGKYIDSPHINDYEVIRTEPIDYSSDERIDTQDKTDAQIRQQLTKVAKDYFKETGNDKIKSEMEVQFAHLWETEEYKDVKVLELVGMGDTVTINHSKLKVNATAIVNYIKYDCIAQVNEEVKLGSVKARLTDSINKIDSIEKKVEQAESNANQAIVSANGKNTTFYGPDEPVEGMKKGDLWFKVIDGQYHKTYRYDGIDWKEILDMDSQEAKEEARQAQERADEAVERANQATEDANAAIGQAQAGFELAQENALELETLGLRFNDVEGNLMTISSTVQGLQTTVSDVQGNVSNLTQLSNTLQTRLSDAEGNINELTLTSQSMQSTISSLQDEWDNLEIGGRNFLLNTTTESLTLDNPNSFDTVSINGITVSPNFLESAKGKKVTISIEARSTGYEKGTSPWIGVECVYYQNDGTTRYITVQLHSTLDTDGEWRRYSRTVSLPLDISSMRNSVTMLIRNIKGFVQTKQPKLEIGNKATDWSPAPEDMATQTQITQLSDAINLRVAKGDVINQINLDTSGVLISGKKLILDGDTTVLGTFKLDGSAHIKDASIGTAQIGTIDAAIANIVNISANSIVGGILSSQNDNMTLNMNTGRLHMENVDFTLGNGADIEFLDRGNKLYYKLKDNETNLIRSAGLIFGTSINDRFPLVGMGISNGSRPGATDVDRWTGFLVNARGRRDVDGIGNSVVGLKFDVRDEAINYSKGFTFELSGNPTFRGINAHNYNYYLGNSDFLFHRLYVRGINTVGNFVIRNVVNTGIGWRLSTIQESGRVSLRGINGGSYNYDLGASESYNHFHFGYINNLRGASSASTSVGSSSNPYTYGHINTLTVHKNFWNNSLREYKENIVDLNLETAIEFVRDNKVKVFNYKGSNDKTVGLIRDDLVGDVSLVATETAISPTSVQYINQKVLQHVLKETDDIKDEVNRLKIENQYLKQKVKQLEEMVA